MLERIQEMAALEVVLIVCGIICIILSFIIDNKVESESISISIPDQLTEEQKKDIKNQIDVVVSQQINELSEKTEAALDKISNTKILEMNEYAQTVLDEINKSHNEIVFLYDMLNEKAKEVKMTVKDVNVAKMQVEKMKEESVNNDLSMIANDNSEMVFGEEDILKTAISTQEDSSGDTNKIEKAVTDNSDLPEDVSIDSASFNKNEAILQLFKSGKTNREIARTLNLGTGEVKLVLDLYNGGR